MNYSDLIIFIMEMMGTVAFAASGAMLGIRKKMDLFGVCVLGVTTSVGGGAIRDVTLGIIPPGMFRRPIYTIVAVMVSLGLFALLYIRRNLLDGRIGQLYDLLMTRSVSEFLQWSALIQPGKPGITNCFCLCLSA